jgi:uncharacterized protein YcaQ
VYSRIEREGPLRTSDFERNVDRPATGWWDWTPEKAALEYLWHTGRLAIHGRDGFQKVYDLMERVFPEQHASSAPAEDEHIDWACIEAMNRLGVATPGELAAFFASVSIKQATQWCDNALGEQRIVPVIVEAIDGSKPRKAFAAHDWQKRIRQANDAPKRMRLLAPFDPIIRDRKRAQRLFDFDYRFEAFVPAKKRKYGYYVLPILEGDRLVGRVDAKTDREASCLQIDRQWWESGVKVTQRRKRMLAEAAAMLAAQVGVKDVQIRSRAPRSSPAQ